MKEKIKFNIPVLLMTLILSASCIRMSNNYYFEIPLIDVTVKYGLLALSILYILIYKNQLKKIIIIEFIIVLFIILNLLIFPENIDFAKFRLGESWMYLLVIFLCTYSMDSDKIVKSYKYSAIVSFPFCLCLINSTELLRQLTQYSYGGVGAVFSYILLLPATTFLCCAKWEKKPLYIIPSAICVLIILLLGGNRMSLLIYCVLFFYLYLWKINKKTRYGIIGVLSGILLLFMLNYSTIINLIGEVFHVDASSVRIIDQFVSHNVNSSGRDEILYFLINNILSVQGFIIGFGIFGDSVITPDHQYSHNFFLELLVEFGIIYGIIIIIFICNYIYKAIRQSPKSYKAFVLLITGCSALLVSGTFWNNYQFWMLLSFCIHIHNNKVFHNKIRINNSTSKLQIMKCHK